MRALKQILHSSAYHFMILGGDLQILCECLVESQANPMKIALAAGFKNSRDPRR
jgi:hypothetical protein